MNNEIENIISHIQPEEDSEKIKDYVNELEQQKAELEQLLIASRRANNSLKASYNYNRLQKLEQQNKELIEIAKEYSYLLLSQQSYDFNNEHDLKRGEGIETLLENIT